MPYSHCPCREAARETHPVRTHVGDVVMAPVDVLDDQDGGVSDRRSGDDLLATGLKGLPVEAVPGHLGDAALGRATVGQHDGAEEADRGAGSGCHNLGVHTDFCWK